MRDRDLVLLVFQHGQGESDRANLFLRQGIALLAFDKERDELFRQFQGHRKRPEELHEAAGIKEVQLEILLASLYLGRQLATGMSMRHPRFLF